MSTAPPADGARVEELLTGLTESQRAAVVSDAAPLCILASAGAGKTRVLTRRIAYRIGTGSMDATHVMALTFTRKAAAEMQDRLSSLGLPRRVAAGTFHAMASAQLQRWWSDRGQTPPTLLDRKARLLAPLAAARPGLADVPVSELAGHIEWAKARLVCPEQFEEASRAGGRVMPAKATAGAVAGLYRRYEDEKVRRGLVDFDDLLAGCADAIERDPAFASAQRWRWRHVFVDEFQDVNPLQHRLLLAWLGSSTDLCVVGDPNQAVYGWNGADPELLNRLPDRWPTAEVIRLAHNHRCSPQIVAAAAAVLGPAGADLRSGGLDGPDPVVCAYPSQQAEAAGIAAGLHRAHLAGRPWRRMAVLTRTNAQLVAVQEALDWAGVPYWAAGAASLLKEPCVRALLDQLRSTPRTLMQTVIADLSAQAEESVGTSASTDERIAVDALIELARTFARLSPQAVVGQWLAWLPATLADERTGGLTADAVTLCSFHRAKGLEWESVWVAGLEEGLVPIGRATTAASQAEERRLLYVALTRAGRELHCSWARIRTFGGRAVPRYPSPWLDCIQEAGRPGRDEPHGAPAPTAAEWRARLRQQRQELAERGAPAASRVASRLTTGVERRRRRPGVRLPDGWPEPDAGCFSALHAWRAETSRAAGVPAHAVLHDVTLAALAALRPSTAEELLDIPGLGPVKASRYGPALLSLLVDRAAAG